MVRPNAQGAYTLHPAPDENSVFQIASLWSIDPTSIGRDFQEPIMGLLGKIPSVKK
jgi:hypothetical protein